MSITWKQYDEVVKDKFYIYVAFIDEFGNSGEWIMKESYYSLFEKRINRLLKKATIKKFENHIPANKIEEYDDSGRNVTWFHNERRY